MNHLRCLQCLVALLFFGLSQLEAVSPEGELQGSREQSQLETEIDTKAGVKRRFRRQSSKYARLLFVNLSGREVYIMYMDYYRTLIRHKTLRRNEKRQLTTRIHTTWYAYDAVNREYMNINGKYNHLVRRSQAGKETELMIKAKDGKTVDPPKLPSTDKYIEVMVIADSTVYKKRGNLTKKYVLTLMNAAKQLFYHKTFVVKLHLTVVRVMIIKNEQDDFKIVPYNQRRSMGNACNFAAAQNTLSELDDGHFDFAVLLTRRPFGHTGYAPLFQMCNRRHACALVYDKGLAVSHVVAHEIGHSLGIEHDGLYNDCQRDGLLGSIMGKVLWSRFDRFYWSKCSQHQLKMTIGYFYCLDDEPVANITDYMEKLPGVYMDRDEQCQAAYGSGYGRCNGYYECKHTYCTVAGRDINRDCFTRSRPPLEGTSCDKGKGWCIRGKCYPTGRLRPAPVHGHWSKWSRWGSCSVQCGTGVITRRRSCDSPRPKHGGKTCVGEDSELKVCKRKKCKVAKSYIDERNHHCQSMYGNSWVWFSRKRSEELVSSLSGLNCSFESNCSWTQFDRDDFDWSRTSGRTPSQGTGPQADNTHGNDTGYYMYIEASDGDGEDRRKNGYKAHLTSPLIRAPQLCMSFYYHMLGSHLGSLSVYKFDSKEQLMLWKDTEDRGDRWNYVKIDINGSRAFEIHIVAVRGNHYQGDIAIDDIKVVAGGCGKTKDIMDGGPCAIACTDSTETKFSPIQMLPDTYQCRTANRTQNCTGSECEWCIRGTCFPYGLFNYAPIHGGWSNWGSWSPCSSTCDLGTKKRTRKCDNPRPKHDGNLCVGEDKDIMVCEVKECVPKVSFIQKRSNFCNSLNMGWIWLTQERAMNTVTSMPGLNCTFESNCSWQQGVKDDFNWTKQRGKTPSSGTGPSSDHTFGDETGHYFFIEASTGEGSGKREKGYRARLISPLIKVPHICFSFYYHMHGEHLGSLRVFKLDNAKEVLVWNETQDQGDRWKRVDLNMNGSRAFEIHIEAVRGFHYQSDIAVDDLSVRLGSCNVKEKFLDSNSCTIICSDQPGTQFLLNKTLPDGYNCQTDSGKHSSEGICMKGSCQRLKCATKKGPNKTLDGCRVCHVGSQNC